MKQFKTESKRILDLMINSIYTHKEIFLRELISNGSDAIDKLYYKALNEGVTGLVREDFAINLSLDKENRNIIIKDNGIGMTKEELENNLGVIAKSGSLDFKKNQDSNEEIDIIGQFGVGFYSAFMVADKLTVNTKSFASDEAYSWVSQGAEGYSITSFEKGEHGTEIIIHVKENTEDENYDEFLEQYRIQSLVKKYSDYIRYPIKMDMDRVEPKEDGEYDHFTEEVVLNSMVPIWKKSKSEVTDEEINDFYKEKFMDWQDPARVIKMATEGTSTYNALMFIPAKTPMDYYTKEYEKGLQLYASGVLIMDKCKDLLPDYFSFVKGLVDSQDLSLNISREMLQHDRQLKLIASRLEKKIVSELKSMLNNDREKYEEFYKNFGMQIKFGVYDNFGASKESLKDLLLFISSKKKTYVSLKEYVENMPADQQDIYYACGESVDRVHMLPQVETVREKGFEVLYLTDNVDEFALKMLQEYSEKTFKNVSSEKLDLQTEEEKEEIVKQSEDNKDLLELIKSSLGGKVADVIISARLKSHPVCLSSQGEISLEMEKVLNAVPNSQEVKAERVLEINSNHQVFQSLKNLMNSDEEKLKVYADILYTQALIIEGFPVEDPVDFSAKICSLM
ncbi:MAG: molecular chaperone HtpG [Clostridia bacterium]